MAQHKMAMHAACHAQMCKKGVKINIIHAQGGENDTLWLRCWLCAVGLHTRFGEKSDVLNSAFCIYPL
eukprot:410065-Pelagomonas_calceolata.AAC.2